MDRTVELRWIRPGPMPDDVVAWYEAVVPEAPKGEERTDVYLCLPEGETVGVKLRGGGQRLELKVREAELGTVECEGDVFGLVEQWQKWSWPTTSADRLGLPTDVWIEIMKARRLTFVEGPGDWRCQIELTALTDGNDRWWTLGFEAPGSGEAGGHSLRRTAAQLFAREELPVPLDWDDSMGYPAWLARLLSK